MAIVLIGAVIVASCSDPADSPESADKEQSGSDAGSTDGGATDAGATDAPSGSAVGLSVRRLDGESGSALVSSGIPLPPGKLVDADLGKVRVLVGGVEQAVYVEALKGKHKDGSRRAVLVQFQAAVGSTPVSATLEFGTPRGTPDRAKSAIPPLPAAVAVPTAASYLVSTQLVGPTAVVTGSAFPAYETTFTQYSDVHWGAEGSTWEGNYYDRALNHYAYWVRGGEAKYFERATRLAVDYRAQYLEPNNYGASPHWSQLEGLALHYWLTGDERSRTAVLTVADRLTSGFPPAYMGNPTSEYNEGRIQQRVLIAAVYAWVLEDSRDWAPTIRTYVGGLAGLQQANGSYAWPNACGYTKNFMLALQNDALIKSYQLFEADVRIPPMVKKAIDWQWSTQWDPVQKGFKYISETCNNPDSGGDPTPAPDLNMFHTGPIGWYYRLSGDAAYRTMGETVFSSGLAGAYPQGSKQYNEMYYNSFNYLAYRQ
jgi:hypothetical protein